jgi:hypothetical protein
MGLEDLVISIFHKNDLFNPLELGRRSFLWLDMAFQTSETLKAQLGGRDFLIFNPSKG